MQADERRGDGQTKPCPSAFLLGGEKRIAQACQMLRRNADTFVAHLETTQRLLASKDVVTVIPCFLSGSASTALVRRLTTICSTCCASPGKDGNPCARSTCKRSVRFLTKWASKRSARSTVSFNCKTV